MLRSSGNSTSTLIATSRFNRYSISPARDTLSTSFTSFNLSVITLNLTPDNHSYCLHRDKSHQFQVLSLLIYIPNIDHIYLRYFSLNPRSEYLLVEGSSRKWWDGVGDSWGRVDRGGEFQNGSRGTWEVSGLMCDDIHSGEVGEDVAPTTSHPS